MHPKPQEWNEFYAAMLKKSGLDLHQYKANQLQRRIVQMALSKDATSLKNFWEMIMSEREGLVWFQDRLAINVSELFRNPEKWVELEQKVLPELIQNNKRLKIWSAGCSYGAEAHSIACILAEKFGTGHQIIGSDIDQAALTQAKAGEFNRNDMRGVPKTYQKYFEQKGDQWVASPQIKKYMTYKTGNLLADRFDTGYDLICCRNVVIYFTEDAKAALYQKFANALKPGGILFVGGTERISNSEKFDFTSKISFFYQKSSERQSTWRNAS